MSLVTKATAFCKEWFNALSWGQYSAAAPALSDGDGAPVQLDASGNLKIATAAGGSLELPLMQATFAFGPVSSPGAIAKIYSALPAGTYKIALLGASESLWIGPAGFAIPAAGVAGAAGVNEILPNVWTSYVPSAPADLYGGMASGVGSGTIRLVRLV